MSEAVCKLEDDLCRCCHSEGTYKNLTGVYNIGGTEEIYYDMLRDTFDINLNPIPGILCVATYTICDACIEKLRDASTFKKQVLYYEDKFKDMVSKNLIRGADSDDGVEIKQEIEDEIYSSLPEDAVKVRKRSRVQSSEINDGFDWQCDMSDEDYKEQIELSKKKSKRVQKKKSKIKDELSTENNGKDCEEIAFKKKSNRVQKQKTRSKRDVKNKSDIKDEPEKDNGEGDNGTVKFRVKEADYKVEGNTYICAHCDNRYQKYCSFRYHVKTKHYKVPKFKCLLCSKTFMTPSTFVLHKLEMHNIDDRYRCNACKGIFNSKVQLRKHTDNYHMMGEKYKCDVCDYESFSFEGMYKHKFKHKTVKDYHCKFCKKSFLRRATLVLHERIHTGDRRKVCSVCGQAFVQKASLNYHMTKYHPEVNF